VNRRELLLLLGGAMTAARAVCAQQKEMPIIGFLASTSPETLERFMAAFRQGLSETGYVEGQNVTLEYRWAEDHYDRLPGLAADLVSRKFDVIATARTKALQLPIVKASTESEIDAAFAELVRLHAGALAVVPDPFFLSRREQLVALAAHHAVPAIYPLSEFAEAGASISYAASITAAFQLLGVYAGRILKGEKPADLPIQQPTTFELVVNLKTAKALGPATLVTYELTLDNSCEESGGNRAAMMR
jgi:putative ABC transport system substrate-binding protein